MQVNSEIAIQNARKALARNDHNWTKVILKIRERRRAELDKLIAAE